MTDIPWIVSLDDHVVEPPDVWTKRLPAKYRDVGPHIVMAPARHAGARRRHATARRPAPKATRSPGGSTRTSSTR